MMLPDNLADRAPFLGFAEVGTEPPDDFAVASNNGEKTGLPAADDDVVWSEPLVAFVEPVVRPDVRRGVDMQPVKTASRAVDAGRCLDGVPRGGSEAEFVNMVACNPFPGNVAVPRNFDEAVVFERRVGDVRTVVVRVRQN